MQSSSNVAKSLFEDENNLIAAETGMVLSEEALVQATQKRTIATQLATTATKALATVGNMIVFTLISKGIELAATAISNYINRMEIAQEKTEEAINTYESITSEVNSVASSIEELQKQIDGLDPIANEDDIKNLEIEKGLLEAELAILKEKQAIAKQESHDSAVESLGTTTTSKYIAPTTNTQFIAGEVVTTTSFTEVTRQQELELAMQAYRDYEQQIEELNAKQKKLKESGKENSAEYQKNAESIKHLGTQMKDVRSHANELAVGLQNEAKGLDTTTIEGEELSNSINETLDDYISFTDSLETNTDALNENTSAKQENADTTLSTETLNENINTAYDSISKSYDALEKFKSAMSSGMTDSALDAVAGLSDELKALVAEFYAGAVSADELFEALTEHYNADLKNYGDALIAKNKDNVEFCNSVGLNSAKVNNTFLKNYGVDLSNHKTYAEKKKAIEEQLLSKISTAWTKYYNAQTQTYTSQMTDLENQLAQLKTMKSAAFREGLSTTPFDSQIKQLENYINSIKSNVLDYENAIGALNSITYSGITTTFDTISSNLSSSASKTEKTFDHIETALSNMEDALSDLDSKVSNTYSTWTERNNALTLSINKTKEAIQLQYNAYSAYMSMANSVGLSDFYKNLVHNGAMNISVITDETLANQISQYQDYYEKAQNALKTANELQSTLNEISSSEKWDLIKSESDANISELDAYLDSVQTSIDKLELQGKFANTSVYEDMYNLSVNKITVLKNQADQLSNILGTMSKDTEAYDTMFEELLSIRQEISELENDCIEFNNNIRDLNWEVFEYLENSISRINDEMDYLVGLLANEDLFDENGKRTKYADTTIALHAASYDVYKQMAQDYKEEMLSLQEQLVNGNMDVLEQYYDMVDAHQDAINAANDEKQAILDLVRDGYEAQKDALQDVIDKKKELLNVEKSTYDYQKTIQDLVDERDSIQKQILAYKNDTSESGRSTLQQLESKLADVESQIEETEYEKYLSDLEQMYDLLTSEYEEWMNQRMDDEDALLQEIISGIATEGDEINATLTEVAEKNGTLISDSITSIFDAQSPFTSSLTNISNGVAGTTTAINNLIAKVEGIAGILSASNAGTVSGTGGSSTTSSSITSTPTNVSTSSTPTVTTTTSTNTTSTSSNNSSSGWESALVYSKYLGDKNKLNTNTSIVDLLKKHDKSAEWNDRANLYYAMGGSDTYRGSSSQNRFMIDTMKAKGYKKGSLNIPYDQMSWIHDGEVVLKRVSDGGYLTDLTAASKVLTEEQVQNMLNWSKMNPQVIKPNVNIPSMPTVQSGQSLSTSIGDVSVNIELPNVKTYEEFMTKAQNDSRFEGMIQHIAWDKNPMSKYNYKWQ